MSFFRRTMPSQKGNGAESSSPRRQACSLGNFRTTQYFLLLSPSCNDTHDRLNLCAGIDWPRWNCGNHSCACNAIPNWRQHLTNSRRSRLNCQEKALPYLVIESLQLPIRLTATFIYYFLQSFPCQPDASNSESRNCFPTTPLMR